MGYELDYDMVTEAISSAELDTMAAEYHGNACGLLCSQNTPQSGSQIDQQAARWVESQLSNVEEPTEHIQVLFKILMQLYKESQQQLSQSEFSFSLFLPDDEAPLRYRIEALGEWCSGFLLGLSSSGISDIESLPGELPEFLKDLLEIARVGTYDLQDNEEDEVAYTELVEFVRSGVMLAYEELQTLTATDPEETSYH